MEEDLNDEELEERFYSMLHHVDDSKTDVTPSENALNAIKNAPQSTVRRYWRTDNSRPAPSHYNSPFQKINTPKIPPKLVNNDPKPKTEKSPIPAEPLPQHLSIFQTLSPHNVKKTIEIIEHEDDKAVEIVTSDEDEVIEVALPPKPTITIDSSDDELVAHVTPTKTKAVPEKWTQSREVSSSPVPSIVSSVSDDFIRGDCVAFNISRRPEKNSFDFSLHEADLDVGAPPKKKKKKKNKDNANTTTFTPIAAGTSPSNTTTFTPIAAGTSPSNTTTFTPIAAGTSPSNTTTFTPIAADTTPSKPAGADEHFATPKSKAKNKKSKTKLYTVTETSIPNADVYDSDSNQSAVDVHSKNQNCNDAKKISPPPTRLFEDESVSADTSTNKSKSAQNSDVSSSHCSTFLPKENLNSARKEVSQVNESVIDLTENVVSDNSIEDIVMANVVGYKEPDDLCNEYGINRNASLGSTKVPAILLYNHDFYNIKNADRPSRKRRYSMTTIRNDMQTFYNDSWGGEEFNHREIQKNMSRDKSLWVIDMQDKMPMHRKKFSIICNYCHRPGHRDVSCWQRPAVCHMCGATGHRESKCPFKICVNCGTPNSAFSELCGACAGWGRCVCAHCRQRGHPLSHCAVLWRRHHHTIYDPSRPLPPHMRKKTPSNNGQEHAAPSAGGMRLSGTQPLDAQINPNQLRTSPVENYTSHTITAQSNTELSSSNQTSTSTCQDTNLNRSSIERAQINSRTPTQDNNRKSPLIKYLETSVENNDQTVLCLEVDDTAAPGTSTTRAVEQGNATSPSSLKRKSMSPMEQTDDPLEQLEDATKHGKVKEVESERIGDLIEDLENCIQGKFGRKEKAEPDPIAKTEENPAYFESVPGNVDVKGILQDSVSAEPEPLPVKPNIPLDKIKALQLLNKALYALKQDLDPNDMHRALIGYQNSFKTILSQQVVKTEHLQNILYKIDNTALRLNSILIGRAGLLSGAGHVRHLNHLKHDLSALPQSTISDEQRSAIRQHYDAIFSHVPRKDYARLLESYNVLKKNGKIQKDETGIEETQINDDPLWNKKEREEATPTVPQKKHINIVNESVGIKWVHRAYRRLRTHWRYLTTKRKIKGNKIPSTKSLVKMIRALIASLKKHPRANRYKRSVVNIETQLQSLLTRKKIKLKGDLPHSNSKELKAMKESTSKTKLRVRNINVEIAKGHPSLWIAEPLVLADGFHKI